MTSDLWVHGLVPGGRARIVVPDGELVVRRYIEEPDSLVEWRGGVETAMEAVNALYRQRYEHQFIYDWPTIVLMLQRAGFDVVTRSEFGHGELPDLILDDPKYEWESLYVEAICVAPT